MREMGRFTASFEELAEINMAVDVVLKKDTTVQSPADMLFNISGITGITTYPRLASLLRIQQTQIQEIIDGDVDKKLKEKLRKIYVATRIMHDHFPNPADLIHQMTKPNSKLKAFPFLPSGDRSPIQCIKDGDIDQLLVFLTREEENINDLD